MSQNPEEEIVAEDPVKREHRRAKGVAPVVCEDTWGRLHDISRGGVAFSISENFSRFVIGKQSNLTIKIPPSPENPERVELQVLGLMKSIRQDSLKEGRMIVGYEWLNLDEEQRLKINRIILFFARNSVEFQALDRIFNVTPAQVRKDGTDKGALQKAFNFAIQNYETLPENLQSEIKKLFKIIEGEMSRRG